ncbi:MAG: hypothetical protein MHPSP_001266, partial [Paramarteilia canceri]
NLPGDNVEDKINGKSQNIQESYSFGKDLNQLELDYKKLSSLQKLEVEKNYQLTEQIKDIENINSTLNSDLKKKNSLIEMLNKEVDDWHLKSNEIESVYQKKIDELNTKIRDMNLAMESTEKEKTNLIDKLQEEVEKNEKLQIEAINSNIIQKNETNVESKKVTDINSMISNEITDKDFKFRLEAVNNAILAEKRQTIDLYENIISDFKIIHSDLHDNDMRVVVAKNVEKKLYNYLNELIKKDQIIVSLQEERTILEAKSIEQRYLWEKREKDLLQINENLNEELKKTIKFLNLNTSPSNMLYLKKIIIELVTSKDPSLKFGMMNALGDLLQLDSDEVIKLKLSLK